MGRPAAQSSQVPQTSLVPLSTLLPTSVASTQGTSFWLYSNSAESSLVGALSWHPPGPARRDPSRSPSGIRTHRSFCVLGPRPTEGPGRGNPTSQEPGPAGYVLKQPTGVHEEDPIIIAMSQ